MEAQDDKRRTQIKKFETRLADEAEERKAELAKKVESATFEQISAQIADDLTLLRAELPTPVSQAVATALDMKYIRDRQMTPAFKKQKYP